MTRLVIDPVTRIEGHLRIEAEVDSGLVKKAWASGTMFRGLELILKGRDPRDAWYFVQRICSVCTAVHAIASVRAVENALGITIPENAQLIRNLIEAMQYIHDHVMHFYHLHALDWVDVTSALNADPKKTSQLQESISDWPRSNPRYFQDVKDRLETFVDSGQLGIFANGYWGHPAYKLPPEADLLAVAHYINALDWQKSVSRFIAILGGRHPCPNFLVGGMATAINPDSDQALNASRLILMKELLQEAQDFVEKVYFPDVLAIASFYPEWTKLGEGLGNFLACGDFQLDGPKVDDSRRVGSSTTRRDPVDKAGNMFFPSGVIWNRKIEEVKKFNQEQITEYVSRSWYTYSDGSTDAKHPFDGETNPKYTGPKPPYDFLTVDEKYSWIKSPRYDGKPVEVGPLARVLVAYGMGQKQITDLVDKSIRQLGVGKEALFSTLGRTLARAIETVALMDEIWGWYNKFVVNIGAGDYTTANTEKWEPSTWPAEAQGVGFVDAPRGALGHWIKIKNGKIDHYQMVVPTTWNSSPPDPSGQIGAYEASLVGTPVVDADKPIEVLRTIHSFDPCIACAVHVHDAGKKKIKSAGIMP